MQYKNIIRYTSISGAPGYEVRIQATPETFVSLGFFTSAEEARKYAQELLYPWERSIPKLKKMFDDINQALDDTNL